MEKSLRRFADPIELVNYHLGLHESVELRDIYKMLHQSVFGPEHLGEAASEEAIAVEMREAEKAEFGKALLEPISADGKVCRINLRTASRRGISPSLIAEAMTISAGLFSRDAKEFGRLWRELGESLEKLAGEFDAGDYERLTEQTGEKGFPSLHHSHSYRQKNRPAYRVIKKGSSPEFVGKKKG